MSFYKGKQYNNRYGSAAANKTDDGKPKRAFFKKQEPIVKIPFKPMLSPTVQQVAVIDEIVNGTDNLVMVSRAGVGKTATIMQAISQLPSDKS